MSNALPGEHYCLKHQGNHSHYDECNCTVCKLTAQLEAADLGIKLLKQSAISDIDQIYGLLRNGKYDEADDYCRCAAQGYSE